MIFAERGALNNSNDALLTPSAGVGRAWGLDVLGNWSGSTLFAGYSKYTPDSTPGLGIPDLVTATETYGTNRANQLQHVEIDADGEGGGDPNLLQPFVYDATGSLTQDLRHEYVYDAWNRLVEVRDVADSSLIKKYRYDALHRKINAQGEHFPGELYYYDGHRVLDFYLTQTVNVECPDPPDPGGGGTENKSTQSNNPSESGAQLAADNIYESLKSSSKDSTVTFGGGGGGGGGDPTGCTALLTPLERSYVYGPHYIDEQVAQFNQGGGRYYVLQDANYNVVALTDATGQIHRQFSFEPYGDLFAAEKGPTATAVNMNSEDLAKELDNWYFFGTVLFDHQTGLHDQRGRVRNDHIFLQRDPNELALLFVKALSKGGQPFFSKAGLNGLRQYGNGLHVYQFVKGNPNAGFDPSGLAWNHWLPLYLGGTGGPITDFAEDAHHAYHVFLDDYANGAFSRRNPNAAQNFAALSPGQRRAVLMAAADYAGYNGENVEKVIDSALSNNFDPGTNNSDARANLATYVEDIEPTRDTTWRAGRTSADRLDDYLAESKNPRRRGLRGAMDLLDSAGKVGTGLAIVGFAATAGNLLDAINNPYVRDIAMTTRRWERTREMSMIDEVYVYYDFYQLTNNPIAASGAWTYWQKLIGLD